MLIGYTLGYRILPRGNYLCKQRHIKLYPGSSDTMFDLCGPLKPLEEMKMMMGLISVGQAFTWDPLAGRGCFMRLLDFSF